MCRPQSPGTCYHCFLWWPRWPWTFCRAAVALTLLVCERRGGPKSMPSMTRPVRALSLLSFITGAVVDYHEAFQGPVPPLRPPSASGLSR